MAATKRRSAPAPELIRGQRLRPSSRRTALNGRRKDQVGEDGVEEKRVSTVAGLMRRAGGHCWLAAQRMKRCCFRKARAPANASEILGGAHQEHAGRGRDQCHAEASPLRGEDARARHETIRERGLRRQKPRAPVSELSHKGRDSELALSWLRRPLGPLSSEPLSGSVRAPLGERAQSRFVPCGKSPRGADAMAQTYEAAVDSPAITGPC